MPDRAGDKKPPAQEVFDELRRTGEHVMLFNEIAKALTSTLKPHEVLQVIMQQVSALLQPSAWSLLLEDERTGDLYFEIAVGQGTEGLRGLRLAPNEGVAGIAFSTGEVQIVEDTERSEIHSRRFDQITKTATRNIVALPLKVRGRTLGVLELVNGLDRTMRREDLQALKAIADYAAIAIENARNFQRVRELTIIDEHTGLYNARHLRERLAAEVERSVRFAHPVSLLFLDLDRFKSVNDQHGHLIGSAILQEVGQVLVTSVRKVDAVFRYGGDEFAILLIETAAAGARTTAARIRRRMEQKVFLTDRGLAVKVTASCGIATYPDDASTASDLLHAADQAMYRAKALGRNEVVAASDAPREPEGGR